MRNAMHAALSLLLLTLIVGCTTAPSARGGDVDRQFTTLAEQIWTDYQALSPEGQLDDYSETALAERHEQKQTWLAQLKQVPTASLNEQNQINHTMLVYRLQNDVDSYTYNEHYQPLNAEGGFHSYLAFMARGSRFRDAADYTAYLDRLVAIPTYMEQQLSLIRKGVEQGYSQPQQAMQGFEESILAFIVQDPTDSVFFEPFLAQPEHIDEATWNDLVSRAEQVIDTQVVPAYQDFFDYMVIDYLPNARATVGASDLPNGEAYYANRIKHFTTTDMTAEEIHALGLQEVARIRNAMQVVIEKTGFDGSFADFIEFLRTDPQFYPETADELLKEAAYISKKMDGELPKFFKKLPRQPYGIAPVPAEIAPKYTTGRYAGSSRDDRAGFYWVNTYALDRRPMYEMEALTLHEAVPGHHLQIALARELEGVPSYRQQTYISAFGEGWGLYAEHLGIEAGFYQDPYSDFGRLSFEMWRAARLVVDTGIHALGWTRQQALDYMGENTALSMHNVTTEIDRYITWPGQALSYKLGEIVIKRLRREAEEALGADFDIREFHHAVLRNGSVPLQVLEQQVRDWIDSQLV